MSAELCATHLNSLDATAFEEWLRVYFQETYGLPLPPQRYGRSGQRQEGVDLMFRNSQGEWVGVQAKAYKRTSLTRAKLDTEIASAHEFEPPLTHYVVCTLNDRNAALQAHARGATIHGQTNVSVLALQDLAEEASRRQSLMEDLLNRAEAGYLAAVRHVLQPSLTPALAVATSDPSFVDDQILRAIGAWTEAGNPQRALADLAAYTGSADRSQRLLVEVRARFALGELEAVVQVARDEGLQPQPNATLLAYGAHAAALLGDHGHADAWLAQALAIAPAQQAPQVVGAYLRVHAQRDDSNFDALERFATSRLGDALPVALALADTAFQLGDFDAALSWYERARARQAHWPPGARGNELGARIWNMIRSRDDGNAVDVPLRDCAGELMSMLTDPSLQAAGLRLPLLINLGHARHVLGDFQAATEAWDEALDFQEAPPSLWLHRCVLSAVEGIPLPSEDLIRRWATTHMALLVLASACTMLGHTERAAALIDTVLADTAASPNDRVLAHIERIRLESFGQDDRVTPAQVATMLEQVDLEQPSLPLFAWLVGNFGAAGAEQGAAVRAAVIALATNLPVDPKHRMALVEDLLRSQLDEVAIAWLPDIEREAWADRAQVTQLSGAVALLRIYTLTLRFDDVRRLVDQLSVQFPQDPHVAAHCAHALHSAGDRLGAYEVLTAAIRRGIQDGDVIGTWARLAVMLKRRREAHRLLRDLQLAPRHPKEYGELLQARALLGLQGEAGLKITSATQVTPDNVGAVFTSGLLHRTSKPTRAAYGRVVHLRIAQGDAVRLDEHVLLLDEPGDGLSGVRELTKASYPWIAELVGARVGEIRTLTGAPFTGQNATIVDVVAADRWSVMQAAQLIPLLPPAATGVEAISADVGVLQDRLSQQVNSSRRAREDVLSKASDGGSAISLIAPVMNSSPRALLRSCLPWRPTGHPGSTEEIRVDDQALVDCARLVLDPVTLLLMVDINADGLLTALPAKPVMTPQAAWQLFDWWYELERHHRGTAAHVTASAEGKLIVLPVTAERRRETLAFWQRVLNAVIQHIELVQPPPVTNTELQQCVRVLGTPVISGMAVAAAHGWAYVTEESMLRAVAIHVAHAQVGSLHRLLVIGATRGWWRPAQALAYLSTLIRHGWTWISFPVSMLRTALRLPTAERGPIIELLLRQMKRAEPTVAIRTLFALLRDLDKNVYPGVDASRLRKLIGDCLPAGISREQRLALSQQYARLHTGRLHRASRRCIERWANRPVRGQSTEAQ